MTATRRSTASRSGGHRGRERRRAERTSCGWRSGCASGRRGAGKTAVPLGDQDGVDVADPRGPLRGGLAMEVVPRLATDEDRRLQALTLFDRRR